MNQEHEERGLLEDIRNHPADDVPRLIYADWLEDHGQPDRAEFIHAQIALDTGHEFGTALSEERRQLLERRASELLSDHQEWAQPLTALGLEARDIDFHRGFPDEVTMPAKRFLKNLDHLFTIAPVTSLQLTGSMNQQEVQALIESPYLANLTHLDLWFSGIGSAGAQALAGSPYLANLTHLDLRSNAIGPEGAQALANSPHLANLTTLDLSANDIGNEGAQALAGSPHLANLTHLDLWFNAIGPEGAQALANSPHLANLTTLNLWANGIGNAFLTEIERTLQSRSNGQGQHGGRGV